MEKVLANFRVKASHKNSLLLRRYENLPKIKITADEPSSGGPHTSDTTTTTVPLLSAGVGEGVENTGSAGAMSPPAVIIEEDDGCSTATELPLGDDPFPFAPPQNSESGATTEQHMLETGGTTKTSTKVPNSAGVVMDSLMPTGKYVGNRDNINRASTGTLNRLFLVAQALENELDLRRGTDMNGSRIVFSIRTANIVLLLLINILLFTGIGQYYDRQGVRVSVWLTLDKWYSAKVPGHLIATDKLPSTFSRLQLTGQFCATGLCMGMLLVTLGLQAIHCAKIRHSKVFCIFNAFACVPFALFIFGIEMHYSSCPWLDDYYRAKIQQTASSHIRGFGEEHILEKYYDTQCGINGWALAGIFSLLSCGLFVSEGLITAFFKTNDHYDGHCCHHSSQSPTDKPTHV